MRLFFAIALAPEVRTAIAELQEELRPQIRAARFVLPANVHLTIRFLGECEPEIEPKLDSALSRSVGALKRFRFRFRGCGAFPSAVRARVLWVGVHEPDEAVFRLQSTVEESVRALGFAPEKRSFRPHLTIARFKRPDRSLGTLLAPLSERDFGETDVSELVLFESRLARSGATYHVRKRLALGGSG